jgi:uncharacterized membrane protein YqiK
VSIAELDAKSEIKRAEGEAEAIKLKASGEAEAIRAKGDANAEAYKVGVKALGEQGFTTIQLMQLIADGKVRIVPDVSVTSGGQGGMVDGLLGVMLADKVSTNGHSKEKEA